MRRRPLVVGTKTREGHLKQTAGIQSGSLTGARERAEMARADGSVVIWEEGRPPVNVEKIECCDQDRRNLEREIAYWQSKGKEVES